MKKTDTLPTDKVFQVRYINPRNSPETFWAQDVWEVANAFRFVGCRIFKTTAIKDRKLFHAVRLNNITIPATMTPTITECDQPEWWNRSILR